MNTKKSNSPEVSEHAVRLVFEHQGDYEFEWAAMTKFRYSDNQIKSILKQAEAGTPVTELCHEHSMSDTSFYNCRLADSTGTQLEKLGI